ncbi:hypothetical protein SASPL_133992 [Salvia splendens]|uniref:Exocyst complex component Sec3 PIP2-binding N-terminal domain-containing protein n=1 Tax=Salvia splendens TaxID=180675 RepID=A0A8X8ZIM5_SALSN|nr:hypothetical protein SASPL_133992 [Salvia splendens]
MAKSSADDEELRRACAAAIEGTNQEILMSIRVAKSRGIWAKSGKLGRNHMAKPRVLAISTKAKGQGASVFLRVLKYSTGGVLEPAKLYKLKHLSKVDVVTNDPSGCTFMLVCPFRQLLVMIFLSPSSSADDPPPPPSMLASMCLRNRLLLCILNICKDVLGRLPKVVGIDVVEMALWAKENTPAISKQQGVVQDGPIVAAVAETDTKVTVERELVSQVEEEDMEALLGTGTKKASWYHNLDYEEIQFLPDMVCDVCLFMHKIAIS